MVAPARMFFVREPFDAPPDEARANARDLSRREPQSEGDFDAGKTIGGEQDYANASSVISARVGASEQGEQSSSFSCRERELALSSCARRSAELSLDS